MANTKRQFAIVTGASTGIGLELAKICAGEGYDLVLAANEAEIENAASACRALGANVTAVNVDLSTLDGVDKLYRLAMEAGRSVDALFANAGRTLGHTFLDQAYADAKNVLYTDVVGTVALVHKVGRDMRSRKQGRILITGSIAGFIPGTYQAVYNASKAFLNSFSYALRHELKDSGVTVTCLMPGATDTEVFDRGGMSNTAFNHSPKQDPATVARAGYDAMMADKGSEVPGFMNKVMTAVAGIVPQGITAALHGVIAKPRESLEKTGKGQTDGK